MPLSAALARSPTPSAPAWRRVLRWPTAAGAVISGASAFVAAESGEALQRRVSAVRAEHDRTSTLLRDHVDWGDRAKLLCLLFMGLTLLALWFAQATRTRSRPAGTPSTSSSAPSSSSPAVAAVVTVVLAGHAGSAGRLERPGLNPALRATARAGLTRSPRQAGRRGETGPGGIPLRGVLHANRDPRRPR